MAQTAVSPLLMHWSYKAINILSWVWKLIKKILEIPAFDLCSTFLVAKLHSISGYIGPWKDQIMVK